MNFTLISISIRLTVFKQEKSSIGFFTNKILGFIKSQHDSMIHKKHLRLTIKLFHKNILKTCYIHKYMSITR